MGEPSPVGTEDQRKLHAEINQILNQRFLLTTAAITVFGAFSSWMIPKDPGQNGEVLGRLVFAGTSFLLLFLLLLYAWNRWLSDLQQRLGRYLKLTRSSKWETDSSEFHDGSAFPTTGHMQFRVFMSLGLLAAVWPFTIAAICDLPLSPVWVTIEVVVAVVYAVLVYGLGVRKWFRDAEGMERRWRKVLGLDSPEPPPPG